MTTQQLYQKTINEEMSSSDFLWNVRRNPQYYNIINGLMSFEDTVKVLKGRGHIWENSKESAIKPFSLTGTIKSLNEAAKSNKQPKVTADMVNYYEFTKGWKKELEKNDDLDKAKEKAIANIVKDPNYYTRLEMEAYQKSKSKKESKNLPIDISKKNANYKDDANQMQKLDKAKPKSNVEDGLAKKERAKSKSAGLKSMKGGYPQMKKINEADETNADNKESYFLVKRDGTQSKTQLSDAEVAKFKELIEKNIKAQKDYDKELADHRAEIARGEYKMENPVPQRSDFVEIIKVSDAQKSNASKISSNKLTSTEINRLKKQQELRNDVKKAQELLKAKEEDKKKLNIQNKIPVLVFVVDKNDKDVGKIIPKSELETIDGITYPKTGGKWIPMGLTKEEIQKREENAKKRQIDYKQGDQGFYNIIKIKKEKQSEKEKNIKPFGNLVYSTGDLSNNQDKSIVGQHFTTAGTPPSKPSDYRQKFAKITIPKKEDTYFVVNIKDKKFKDFGIDLKTAREYAANNNFSTAQKLGKKVEDIKDYKVVTKNELEELNSSNNFKEYLKKETDKLEIPLPTPEKNIDLADYFSVNINTKEYKGFKKEGDAQTYSASKNLENKNKDYKNLDKKGFKDWLKRTIKEKNKSTSPKLDDLDSSLGLYTKSELDALKQSPPSNLLESIIRKKIKSFLKENEIGKYIGVEGPDVKKKD